MNEVMPPDWAKFQVGQRVWCVSNQTCATWALNQEMYPQEGEIYTIRELTVGVCGTPACRLAEIVNVARQYVGCVTECAFGLWMFAPLREENIEVFRQMCIKSPTQNTKELETVR